MKLKNKNIVTILNIISTIILQGLAFFSGPIFSSVLGTGNYGIASVYLTWVQLASTVFSLQAAGTVAIARAYFTEDEQQKYQSSVLSLATLSYICFSLVTVLVVWILARTGGINIAMVVIGLIHGWGLYCVGFMNSKFTYEFKAHKNFLLSVVTSLLTISVSVVLIRAFPADTNYWGRILGQCSVYAVIGAAMYIYMLVSGRTFYKKEYWSFTLPIAIPTIFHLLANIVLNQSDKVMLQGLAGNSAAGIYSLACTFGTVLNTIWAAFNNSWVPFYYEYTKLGRVDEIKEHSRNYIELFTIVTMGFILLSREVFHIYADKSFWSGADLIPVFAVGYYFVFLYSFPVNYEFYNKKTRTIAVGTTFAAVCNIVLNIIFINFMGIYGAVLATAVSHGLQFLFHYMCARRIAGTGFPFSFPQFIPGLTAVAVTCIFYQVTREFWPVRWGIGVLLGIYLLLKVIRRREIF